MTILTSRLRKKFVLKSFLFWAEGLLGRKGHPSCQEIRLEFNHPALTAAKPFYPLQIFFDGIVKGFIGCNEGDSFGFGQCKITGVIS